MHKALEKADKVYSFWAPIYDIIFGPHMDSGRKEAVEALQLKPNDKVLEVGFGTGLTLRHYPDINLHIYGIDISEKMLEKGKERLKEYHKRSSNKVELKIMDAHNLEFNDNTFDAVLCPYVLTVVPKPEIVCKEIKRVLKPNGKVVVVNHVPREQGVIAKVEKIISPLCARLGFVTHIDTDCFIQNAGLIIEYSTRVGPLRLYKVVRARKLV